ncbi:aspartate/glutamate racemase family protein [Oceaniglobus ichthyenteri]|uniref:aspartate/glutamate racemase family protein n=1 Tax=Oceaniglobus ichthyenteri TaxID=2136177 RepID=UPI000D3C3B93|nr:amino acid racemase [Oceaniglobus ichthyenteri]
MSAPRRIGVLGGMGPEATVLLMSRLIAATPADDDADHIPLSVDMNPQVPSRIARLIDGTGDDPAPVLAAMAQGLARAGAQALAMPCNTAHNYADAIRDAVEIPLLDMVDLSVVQAASQATNDRIGILGSPALQMTGLFDRVLGKRGLTALYPQDQAAMLAAIRGIKSGARSGTANKTLKAAAQNLASQGASVNLIACTEFSLIADAAHGTVVVIDTLDVLVKAMVGFALGTTPDKHLKAE